MCMLCLRRKSREGYIVYNHSKDTVFHGPFLLLAYLFLILAGQGANSIMTGVLKHCPDVISLRTGQSFISLPVLSQYIS